MEVKLILLYSCQICGKDFPNPRYRAQHFRYVHCEPKFPCPLCSPLNPSITFTRRRDLQTHLSIHTNETPYSCDICCKSFKRKNVLVRHRRIHTGETLHECPESGCNERFGRKDLLQIHMRKIHTGQKPWVCGLCGQVFDAWPAFDRHAKNHTKEMPWKCKKCGREFKERVQLQSHKFCVDVSRKEKPEVDVTLEAKPEVTARPEVTLTVNVKEEPEVD